MDEYQAQQATDLDGYEGSAGIGFFNPGKYAQEILKICNYGEMFAYLFRRFGYPLFGYDQLKDLAAYRITTPMEGVLLAVYPNPSGVKHSFGYALSEELDQICDEATFGPVEEWRKQMMAWAKKEHGTILVSMNYSSEEELDIAASIWLNKQHPDTEEENVTENHVKEFWDEQRKTWGKYHEKYKEVEPFPSPYDDGIQEGIRLQISDALKAAIFDLKRPTYIRDVYINICGRVFDDSDLPPGVDPSPMAGYGLIGAAKLNEEEDG